MATAVDAVLRNVFIRRWEIHLKKIQDSVTLVKCLEIQLFGDTLMPHRIAVVDQNVPWCVWQALRGLQS